MSITLDLPVDLALEAQRIPDLEGRIVLFPQQQVDLEKWRACRYRPEVESLIKAAEAEAYVAKLSRDGVRREQLFAEFIQLSGEMDNSCHNVVDEDSLSQKENLDPQEKLTSDEEVVERLRQVLSLVGSEGIPARVASERAGVFYLRAVKLMAKHFSSHGKENYPLV